MYLSLHDITEEKPLKAINEACEQTSPFSPALPSLIPPPNRQQYRGDLESS